MKQSEQGTTKDQVYRATSKAYPYSHVHFGDYAAAKAWAGEGGSVEPVSLRTFASLRAVGPEDIVDELEARGDDLSMRAARYIRIKRTSLEGTERAYRRLCEKSLEWGRTHD